MRELNFTVSLTYTINHIMHWLPPGHVILPSSSTSIGESERSPSGGRHCHIVCMMHLSVPLESIFNCKAYFIYLRCSELHYLTNREMFWLNEKFDYFTARASGSLKCSTAQQLSSTLVSFPPRYQIPHKVRADCKSVQSKVISNRSTLPGW